MARGRSNVTGPQRRPAAQSAVDAAAETVAQLTSTLDAPQRVIDLATGLPSLTSLFSEMRPLIDDPAGATIFYVHLASNPLIEEHFGWEAQGAYVELVHSYLNRLAKDMQRDRLRCVVARAYADDYVIIVPHREGDDALSTVIADEMRRHVLVVDEELAALHEAYLGMVRMMPFARIHPERLLYRAIQSAQTEATDVGRQKLAAQARLLDRCLREPECFAMVYQPLVDIETHAVYAYEALVRCSAPAFKSPHVLLNVAEQTGRMSALSRILRERAIEPIADLPDDALLFINVQPLDFEDEGFLGPDPFIAPHAGRVVFEVTERAAIGDFARFREKVSKLREAGLRIAIDDFGSGYAALGAATELDPDYIKFDMTLVRNIDKSQIRQNLIRNMVAFAVEAKVQVVAEGVETKEELDILRELGCHYVQGFYLARPGPPFVRNVTERGHSAVPRSAVGIPTA